MWNRVLLLALLSEIACSSTESSTEAGDANGCPRDAAIFPPDASPGHLPDAGPTLPDACVALPDAGDHADDAGDHADDAGDHAHDAGDHTNDAGDHAHDAGDHAHDAGDHGHDGGQGEGRESWIWPYNTNVGWPPEIVDLASHAGSFTHLSPTFYDINYTTTYVSGVPYYVTCTPGACGCTTNGANDFGKFSGLTGASSSYNGQTITTHSFTSWAHSLGFKVVPAIYGGAGNCGVDSSIQAILCGGNGASGCTAQTNFISSLVSELSDNGYDGWNFDWETGGTGKMGKSYASSYVAFLNALKAALVSAGHPDALVTIDVIVSDINGTYCSSNDGFADFGLLAASSVDRVIIENYVGTFQSAGWTVPTRCETPLKNVHGSAVLSSSNPVGCDYSFTGMMIMMCPPNLGATQALDFEKAVVGLMPGVNGTNPIAGQAMEYLASYGFTKVAVWPQFDDMDHSFLSTKGIVPASADWHTLLANFLER